MTTRTSKRPGTRRGVTAAEERGAPAIAFEVAVVESNQAHQKRVRELATELGYPVALEVGAESVVDRVRADPPGAILVGLPDHETVVADCLALEPDRPVVIASLAAPAATARARAAAASADLFTVRPHSRDTLSAVLAAAEKLAALRERLRALRGTEDLLRERLRRYGQSDLATGFFQMEYFERVLLMELKRARRYRYSLATCLVGLDAWADRAPPPAAAQRLRSQVAGAIVKVVRDIDMAVDLAEDRVLVFLPYTDLEGATRVGKRIAAALAQSPEVTDGGRSFRPAISIGIAALKPGKPVSFARLMRDAQSALKAAQLRGGAQVVVRK
jgi:diguanylate cyclase (GGDEF)-like protein